MSAAASSSSASSQQTTYSARKQTPLHVAAESGKVEEVRRLLGLGEAVDVRDLDGRTPLHLAAIQGDVKVATVLLTEGKADLALLTSEHETVFHLAASTGSLGLLKLFNGHSSSKEWVHMGDSDGKTPLHRAVWFTPKPAIVEYFLTQGAVVDQASLLGYTALHWAAKHGHVESAGKLLRAGGRIDTVNQQGDTPFDLAIRSGQAELAHVLLTATIDRGATSSAARANPRIADAPSSSSAAASSSSSSSSSTATSDDPEGVAYRLFEAAYETGDAIEQIFCLEKLAQLYIENKKYRSAAHILSAASTLAQDPSINPQYEGVVLNRLEQLEVRFLLEKFGQEPPAKHRNYLVRHRAVLQRIRAEVTSMLAREAPIRNVQVFLTENFQLLLCTLIEDSIALLGKGEPKGFAVIGLGSMARGEMSPYSDVEFAFVIENPTPERLSYFRALNELLVLKMINMGETKSEIIRPKRLENGEMRPARSLTPTGFSMDIGGLCPSGKEGIYELIGTPEQLARFQTERWLCCHGSEIILTNAMTTVCHVMGDERLVTRYRGLIERTLDSELSTSSSAAASGASKLRHRRAIQLMEGYVREFQPRLDQEKIDLRGFDVKQELYRLLQTVISGLALYHNLESSNTIGRINELQRKGSITSDGAKYLRGAFERVSQLRVETHLFYKREEEVLYYSRREDDCFAKGLFIITPKISRELTEVYRTLAPLHKRAEAFLEGNMEAFSDSPFYDEVVGTYDGDHSQRMEVSKDLKSAASYAALNPNDISARTALFGAQVSSTGWTPQATQNLKEMLALLKSTHLDRPHMDIANHLSMISSSYRLSGQVELALKYGEESLEMYSKLFDGKPRMEIANILSSLGEAYLHFGDYDRVVQCLESYLSIFHYFHGERPDAGPIRVLGLLARAYRSLKEPEHAMRCEERALSIGRQLGNEKLYGILVGKIWIPDELEIKESIDRNLLQWKPFSGNLQLNGIAGTFQAAGAQYLVIASLQKAIKCYKIALKNYRLVYGDLANSVVGMTLNRLGWAYSSSGNGVQGVECCKSALSMFKELYKGEAHSNIGYSFLCLGYAYSAYGDDRQSAKCYEEALVAYQKLGLNQTSVEIASVLGLLGGSYRRLGRYEEALQNLSSAVSIVSSQFFSRNEHPLIIESYTEMGVVFYEQGKISKSISFYIESLAISRRLYRSGAHPQIAKNLDFLGRSYCRIKMYGLAIKYLDESISIYKKVHGHSKHPDIAQAMGHLAKVYYRLKDFKRALKLYNSSLELLRCVNKGEPNLFIVPILRGLGSVYNALGNTKKALEIYQNSYEISMQTVGTDHPLSKQVEKDLERIVRSLQR